MVHAFAFKDVYLLLDVESGALHELDRAAYDVLLALQERRDPYEAGYPAREVQEILDEIGALEREGSLNARTPEVSAKNGEPVIKSMCLNVAHDCNLRCTYCFASTGDFHGERMLMPLETGKKALDFLLAHSGGRRHLEVDLFGGEPLMNFDAVKEIVAYGRELEKKFDKKINFTITTNGLALSDDVIDWMNREMHNVVISIDGRREVHDALRKTRDGRGSYDIIVEKAKKLVALRGDGEHYIRGTFTSRNLDFPLDVKALLDLGFQQISIEPVVLAPDEENAILEEHLPRIFASYDELASLLLARRAEGKWFNFFHFMVDLGNGPCLKKRLSGCGAGVEYIAVAPDGAIYPCHQFVGCADYRMGSVLTGEYDENLRRRFAGCNVTTKLECASCWAKYFCSGGCAANAYKLNGDIAVPHAITCALERKRTECALGIYALERKS